jgi:dihydroorotate dehydrogenase (NAD+) catalytic subunit
MKPTLSVKLGPLQLKNPVILASGTFGTQMGSFINLDKLGGIITKTITLKPRLGNPPPRIVEVPGGMINSIGLENPGLDKFCEEYLPVLKKYRTVRIVSIAGNVLAEYAEIARALEKVSGIDALELNISCPNVKKGGEVIATSISATTEVVKSVRRVTHRPLIVKLSPRVTDITEIADAARQAGADIIALINTIPAMAVDWTNCKPCLGNITGGLSGPCIKPVALKMVWETALKAKLPIIGIGGIMEAKDVLEFMVVGASAVSVGTGSLVDPAIPAQIVDELPRLLARHKIKSLRELIGTLKTSI